MKSICPVCGSELVQKSDGVYVCPNDHILEENWVDEK